MRDARLAECGDQLRAARLEYAAQSRDLSAAERRIRHLSGEREHRENQLAELQRDLRERHEREERMREAERKLISDIFCCTACQSIWLITADSDTRVTRRPAGEGCNACAGPAGTMRRPSFLIDADDGLIAWERQSRTTAGPAGSVSGVPAPAPSLTLTGLGPQPDSQPRTRGRPEDRIRIGVKLGVDLAALDPQAVSDDVTGWASERVWDGIDTAIPADGCKVLSSVADALDSIPDEIAGCVVWCARAAGAPRVIAEILGGLTTLAIEAHVAPLHAMAQEIRVIGTVSCAAQGADRLERCECARGLARALSADLAANAVEHHLSPAIDELRDLGRPPAIEPPAPITPPAVNPPAAGGISALG